MAKNPSPPMAIPEQDSQPVEEEELNTPSKLLLATTSNASLKQIHSKTEGRSSEQLDPPSLAKSDLPTLEPAVPQTRVSHPPEDFITPATPPMRQGTYIAPLISSLHDSTMF